MIGGVMSFETIVDLSVFPRKTFSKIENSKIIHKYETSCLSTSSTLSYIYFYLHFYTYRKSTLDRPKFRSFSFLYTCLHKCRLKFVQTELRRA